MSGISWDRYAYVKNCSVNYIDQTGHCESLVTFINAGQEWTEAEKDAVCSEMESIAAKAKKETDLALYFLWLTGEIENFRGISKEKAFLLLNGGPVKFYRSNEANEWVGEWKGDGIYIYNLKSWTNKERTEYTIDPGWMVRNQRLNVHEVFHGLITKYIPTASSINIPPDFFRPTIDLPDGAVKIQSEDPLTREHYGYGGKFGDMQFGSYTPKAAQWKEEVADMGVGWTYEFADSDLGTERSTYMEQLMFGIIVNLIP
jgi:hypothetical protein